MREMYSACVHKGYGTWPSPISAEAVATQGLRMGGVAVDGDDVYWLEKRPNEGGRNVLIRMKADGRRITMTTWIQRPHARAGIRRGRVRDRESRDLFSNFSDQRIYAVGHTTDRELEVPHPITPAGNWFYADAAFDAARASD